MTWLIKWLVVFFILLLPLGTVFTMGVSQDASMIEYTDLGKISVGQRETPFLGDIELPYFKSEGITQIPTMYFNALVVHEIKADNRKVRPKRKYMSSDDSSQGIYIDFVEPEESWFSLKMYWGWSIADFTNHTIRQGLFFTTDINRNIRKSLFYRIDIKGPLRYYTIPYGTQKVTLIYSIRFLIYDFNNGELIDAIETEKMGATWEFEWHLPEG